MNERELNAWTHFAAAAVSGILANSDNGRGLWTWDEMVEGAVKVADKMMIERKCREVPK
jgi:hypothetical protein